MQRYFLARIAAYIVAISAILISCSVCNASDDEGDMPPSIQPRSEMRSGGVLQESYAYHRQPAMRMAGVDATSPGVRGSGTEPGGNWYGYGFPVSTFRWGWFGAEHYYPRVIWHDGYYGDCCRYSYRRGY